MILNVFKRCISHLHLPQSMAFHLHSPLWASNPVIIPTVSPITWLLHSCCHVLCANKEICCTPSSGVASTLCLFFSFSKFDIVLQPQLLSPELQRHTASTSTFCVVAGCNLTSIFHCYLLSAGSLGFNS